MVMAGTERAPGQTADVALTARLQWLQQRREQLQEKLALKNNELKNLCLDEAELTGVLPPEIPLEPGESPPAVRKRVGTCFSYPQNIINRLKTNEAEESTLELERQVQVGIAESSLAILNDPAESKAIRRKHRSIYQQSQRRLRELDARLSFIRQAYGRIQRQSNPTSVESTSHSGVDLAQTNAKHRTKKPRPPLDTLGYEAGAKTLPPRNILQESGVSLSPSGIDPQQHQNQIYRQSGWSPRGYRVSSIDDDPLTSSDIRNFNNPSVASIPDPGIDRSRRRNAKYPEHDMNDNHDVYILPDRYRPRTYSQGNNPGVGVTGPKYCQDTERTYRTIPNTYTEEERQMRYRQMQQKRHLESYGSRHNIQQDQQTALHQKPPQHHNYQQNYHLQQHQQQYLDNQSPVQPAYYQSDEFVNRSIPNRYTTDEQRLRKNSVHAQSQQRCRDRREMASLSRLSKTNLQEAPIRPDGQVAAGYYVRDNDEIVWCPDENSDRFGSLDRRKYAQSALSNQSVNCQTRERGGGGGGGGGSQDERDAVSRYATLHAVNTGNPGNRDYVLGLAGASKFSSSSATTSHHQNYNSQVQTGVVNSTSSCYERVSPSPPPRTLLRTQSLGSVETWQQQQQSQGNVVVTPIHGNHDLHQQQQQQQQQSRDANDSGIFRRGKEKEWYETSMDSSYSMTGNFQTSHDYEQSPHRDTTIRQLPPSSPLQGHPRNSMIPGSPPSPPPLPMPPVVSPQLPLSSSREHVAAVAAVATATGIPNEQRTSIVQRRYPQNSRLQASPKSLEIPAESKPQYSEQRRRNNNVVVDDPTAIMNAERSPDLCTIVQKGKYQPYREVTKPFEMSDFYKYSTKYRKRTEAAATATTNTNVPVTTGTSEIGRQNFSTTNDDEDDIVGRRRHDTINSSGSRQDDDINNTNGLVNPVQRRIYEPVQRMTCQPYNNSGRRTAMDMNEDEWRTTGNRTATEDSTVV